MKVLFIIPYDIIPTNSGNKNLLYALLKGVTPIVECDLVILTDSNEDEQILCVKKEFPHVKNAFCFRKPTGMMLYLSRIKFLLSGYPHAFGRYRNNSLARWLCTHANEYDLIHFDMANVAPYQKYCGTTTSLLVASDAYSMAVRTARHAGNLSMFKAGYMLFQEYALRNFEQRNYPHFDIVCVVSDVDASWLRKYSPTASIRTIGIGLSEAYTDMPIKHLSQPATSECKILCAGSINHSVVAEGMIMFLRSSIPILLKDHSGLEICILGKDPTYELKRCMEEFKTVVTHVEYADDYAGFLDQAWIYVYPQQCGSGLQTKVQQAMALGLPVVGFEVSFGGLSVESGIHCYICYDVADMTNKVNSLLVAGNRRRTMGQAASNHVREKFSIKHTAEHMLTLYDEAILKHAESKSN